MESDKRAKIRRRRTLQRQLQLKNRNLLSPMTDVESLQESKDVLSWQIRAGLRTRKRLSALKFVIDPDEMLAGRLEFIQVTTEESQVAEAFMKDYPPPPGQHGHCELDLSKLFKYGIDGIITGIEQRKKSTSGESNEAYESFLFALNGMSMMINHAADAVAEVWNNTSEKRKEELSKILDSCRHIAHHPPRNFRDAVQLLWFAVLGVMAGDRVALVNPGRLDRSLWPWYRTTKQNEALELLEALYLLINDFDSAGFAYAVMVGGVDKDGNDTTNELSYLCLEALRRTGLTYPTVGVCWHPDLPDKLSQLAAELIAGGYSNIAFFNDPVISKGLVHYGVPKAESHHYINSTCVEITPCGGSNVWVATPYFNTCGILLEEIADSCDKPVGTFNEFMANYCSRLEQKIDDAVKERNAQREARRKSGRKPLQSVFTRDCIARGHDIDDGGAVYNWVECSFVGLANLVDSLVIIREEVFGGEKMSFGALKKILDSNFADNAAFHRKITSRLPKYGHAVSEVDSLIQPLLECIQAACAKGKISPDNSPFIPGMFCWVIHERFGRNCGATPDGRLAGFAFADGCGPAQGREIYGPTSGINSVCSWDHHQMIGGTAYNMKFTKSLFDSPEKRKNLQNLIETFMRKGGFEIQINIIDQDILEAARKNPHAYKDLVVRIGGYTDYFTNLSPGMQEELIRRTSFQNI